MMEELVRGRFAIGEHEPLCGSKGGDGQPDKGGRDTRVLKSCCAWFAKDNEPIPGIR